ncbi:Thiamine transporter thi9 [Penicillium atrosanguineum]|uniref:Thiamine transporter thi9 n=1 Tax=Penicillium atrosanguineum TaxID=1132637 RepID=UPI0023A06C8A|nr:Thiamine transporter thi9 [Penicillium atrosanguineum]KAJ5303871.1 Thiamine transporter thi9 [Penicillium atrosanguineum]
MPLISVVSLTFGVTNLPPSSTRRRVLAIMIIPMLPILTGYSELWRIEPSQPHIGFDSSAHPIHHLAAQAESRFNMMIKSQSQTLHACCAEYERRYGRKPPLHFDKWFRAARKQGFLLTDEFDSMMANLEPLWGVAPSDIRARLENVIAASQGEGMYRFTVSQGTKPLFHNPPDWMGQIFSPWFDSEILQTLPNLTLAMNTMDEPKVVVPHDMLSHVLGAARNSHEGPPLPGKNSDLAQHVDFLNIGKQNTWDALSLSCPPDTAARDFSLETSKSPFLTQMGFLSNVTLSKDVCEFPELHNIHAGLRHPESMTITHALVPVFSQAKASCFNDLLYPSPFYAEKLRTGEYKEKKDLDWEDKENIVYWTGSNTGGHSTTENWRSLQRQRLALITTDESHPITLLTQTQQPQGPEWKSINSTFAAISNSTRVRISAAIQCDDLACDEQNDELKIKTGNRDDISDGYKARYNLDIDGNGLSGRFYRLLMSKSAVLKQTLYQEWHDDWLIPWLHYIPISMDLRDFPETVRYLTQEPEGQALGKKVAQRSYDWSRLVLRNEDMRLFWWRLMLEYGRLLNDDRDQMWYRN